MGEGEVKLRRRGRGLAEGVGVGEVPGLFPTEGGAEWLEREEGGSC